MELKTKITIGRCQRGFTLIELLVVMVILGLLASLVGPQVMKQLGSSKVKTAQLQIDEYSSALDLMRLEVGRYPTSEEGLNALIENPGSMMGWAGPYLRKSVIRLDPWGQDYHYRYPGQHGEFDIYSLGADNTDGGEKENKDVASWN
jgi:general secretion pathway protein G